jgi:hypothetical protein
MMRDQNILNVFGLIEEVTLQTSKLEANDITVFLSRALEEADRVASERQEISDER